MKRAEREHLPVYPVSHSFVANTRARRDTHTHTHTHPTALQVSFPAVVDAIVKRLDIFERRVFVNSVTKAVDVEEMRFHLDK